LSVACPVGGGREPARCPRGVRACFLLASDGRMIIIAPIKMARAPRRNAANPCQLELRPRTWGGRRPGAGRPKSGRNPIPHRPREALAARFPVHVTLKALPELRGLRRGPVFRRIRAALRAGCEREGFRLCQFNVLSDHLHLICEARDRHALSRGVQGLKVRLARGINRTLGRSGRVFAERYHARILCTPREVKHCLAYVLGNQKHHLSQRGARASTRWFDPCSSAVWFDGWREPLPAHEPWMRQAAREPPAVAPARTWLLATGWRRHGLLPLTLTPGPARP
jgi:REP element-mobilizing transposase RayT